MNVNMQAITRALKATTGTEREGIGLISPLESFSSYHLGKVASRRKVMNARAIAVILIFSC
jgi:hypothetical protein